MKYVKIFMSLIGGMILTAGYAQQEAQPVINLAGDDNLPACNGRCGCAGNSQAPLGVMTDHVHDKGTWMFSYTYMNTMFNGNNMGAARVSDNTVYKNYMMSPSTMSMNMHMGMLMYGITDRLTVMAMGGYMLNNMTMNMSTAAMSMPGMVMPSDNNMAMATNSMGLTDTKLSALYNFSNIAAQRMIGSLGVGLPTGSIRATGTTMLGDGQRLPYNMQPGTGSYALDPDVTYAGKHHSFYYGANAGADIKLNYNSLGYKDGNLYHATAWAGYQLLSFLSATVRAEEVHTSKISGFDKEVNLPIYTLNDPTTNTANYGGNVVNTYLGLNFYMMKPVLDRFRFMAEYGMPVYQNLNGTQSALQSTFYVGLQLSL